MKRGELCSGIDERFKMAEIRKPAVKLIQGDRTLFLTAFTVGDFRRRDFYRVDRLDAQTGEGSQRVLNKARARSFCTDILAADEKNQAFLPTSVFLATGGEINYDENTKELFFNTEQHAGICPLDVVDGQHRIEGLKMAAEKNERLYDFTLSAVIATQMNEISRRLQFVTVNTKQEPVRESVKQILIEQFTKDLELEGTRNDLPHLPTWLKKRAETKKDSNALRIVRALNNDENCPWYQRVQFADDEKKTTGIDGMTIKQESFVKSIIRHIFATGHPLCFEQESKQIAVLKNYWTAVAEICVPDSDSQSSIIRCVAFKYSGVNFFHTISSPVIQNLVNKNGDLTVPSIKACISSVEDYLPSQSADLLLPEYWRRGADASGLNAAAIAKKAADFTSALAQANERSIKI